MELFSIKPFFKMKELTEDALNGLILGLSSLKNQSEHEETFSNLREMAQDDAPILTNASDEIKNVQGSLFFNDLQSHVARLDSLDSQIKDLKNAHHADCAKQHHVKEVREHFNKIFAETLRVVHDFKAQLRDVQAKAVTSHIPAPSEDVSSLHDFRKEQIDFNKKLKNNVKLLNNLLLQETEDIRDKLDALNK